MKPKLKRIENQVVVVVGATSGIGLETALMMVEKGARVAVVGRSQEGLNDSLERVRSHAEASRMVRRRHNGYQEQISQFASVETGGAPVTTMEDQVISLEGDVTSFDQMKSVADQVIERFGRIDTWVNVAAVSEWALFEDTSPEEFRRIIDVNLVGQAYGAMAALPYMKQQNGGAIIFVSSIAGRVPIPYQAAYVASKHGLLGLAETLRLELKHTSTPVSITAILPASMDTPLFDKARTKLGVEPTPIPPVYDPRMVAKAIVHAAQHPVRELIVGDAGYGMNFMRRLAPTLTANYMGAAGFRQQRSDEPKSAQDPDNLYHHVSGYDQVKSDNMYATMPFSPLTWLSTHPKARTAIIGALAGGAAGLIGWRVVKARNERRRSLRYMLPRQAKKLAKQARRISKEAEKVGIRAGKMAHESGTLVSSLPIISAISHLPMVRRRSFLERTTDTITDTLGSVWGAVQAFVLALPFMPRRKSLPRRMADRVSDMIPFSRVSSPVNYVTDKGKTAAEYVTDRGKNVTSYVSDRGKNAVDYVRDRRKDATKFVSRRSKEAAEYSKDVAEDISKQSRKTSKQAAKLANEAVMTTREARRAARQARREARKAERSIPAVEVEVRDKRTGEKLTVNK